MLNKIKSYWLKLKTEYEKIYNKPFLKDFESSKEYLEIMKSYLLKKQSECPSNVDVVCTFASVELELSKSFKNGLLYIFSYSVFNLSQYDLILFNIIITIPFL